MKALLVGNYSMMMEYLIYQMDQKKMDVFVLCQDDAAKDTRHLPGHTSFRFEFSGKEIPHIFHNIMPDVVVFLGIHGDCYDGTPESVSKVSGDLANLLMCSENEKVKKFIYLSSLEIFEKNTQKKLTEASVPLTESDASRFICNGEQMTEMYDRQGMKTITLRFPILYGKMGNADQKRNSVTDMCYQLLKDHTLRARQYAEYDLLYARDATNAVMSVVQAEKIERSLYHVPGGHTVTNESLAETLCSRIALEDDRFEKDYRITGEEGAEYYLKSDGAVFSREFSFRPAADYEESIAIVVKNVKKLYNEYAEKDGSLLKEEHENQRASQKNYLKTVWHPIRLVLEHALLLAAVTLAFYFLNDVPMFQNIDFFLLYILPVSLGFGVGNGIASVILSTIAQLALVRSGVGSLNEIISMYNTVIIFVYHLVLATLASYSVQHLKNETREVQEKLDDAVHDYELLTEINDANVELKQMFEERMLNYTDSFGNVYKLISTLDLPEPEKILEKSLDVISQVMNVHDISIYQADEEGNCRYVTSTSDEAREMGDTFFLNRYPEMKDALENRTVFMNTRMDAELPMMAAPVFHKDRLLYLLMLWNVEFEDLSLYKKYLLQVMAQIVEGNMEKALLPKQGVEE
ncbi:MAG: NAD(P)-dependent oxidoreductase [Lachnospiraceae bacterium]|nr:NAD(P)-dependent oxidoreductase [Lachnospiraceae bacterium]